MTRKHISRAIMFGTALLVGASASAQDRFEAFGDYSYLHFSPTIGGVPARSFNGGGGGVALNFAKLFQIKADFQGYGSTTLTKVVPVTVILPGGGVIPAGTYSSSASMFTYLFGPVVRIPLPVVKPFGEILFGGSNTAAYTNLEQAIIAGGGTIGISPNQHPFAMAVGGGIDISVSRRLSIRRRIGLCADQILEPTDQYEQSKQLSLSHRCDHQVLTPEAVVQQTIWTRSRSNASNRSC